MNTQKTQNGTSPYTSKLSDEITPNDAQASPTPQTNKSRILKLRQFGTRVLLNFLWWDVIFKLPLLRWFRASPLVRWQKVARDYCALADEMGGLLVKFGQFLSLRIDFLPKEILEALDMLQDNRPAAPYETIVPRIETCLKRPISERFAWLSPQAIASASLAQVHLARLHTGEEVMVKVLRPEIEELIEIDLSVITFFFGWFKYFWWLNEQFNIDELLAEFNSVTRRELNLITEAQNAERFAMNFVDMPEVYIPKVYWAYSGNCILTMENVSYLKVNNVEGIQQTGIDCSLVAYQIGQIYMRQIFVDHFVHADPHPGNIFIKPLPHPDEERTHEFSPNEAVPYAPGRPFQIVFIDFGMCVEIPVHAQLWLREFIIGFGLRDPKRIVQGYINGGILRPNTDVARIEAMTKSLIEDFSEVFMGLMPDDKGVKARQFIRDYQDFVYNYPFQIPGDLLFMYRALGILGTLVRQLEPEFSLSSVATPFALQLVWKNWQGDWQTWLQAVGNLGQSLTSTPPRFDRVVFQAQKVMKVPPPLEHMIKASWSNLNGSATASKNGADVPPPAPTPQPQNGTPLVLSVQDSLKHQENQSLQRLEQSIRWLTATLVGISVLIMGMMWQLWKSMQKQE